MSNPDVLIIRRRNKVYMVPWEMVAANEIDDADIRSITYDSPYLDNLAFAGAYTSPDGAFSNRGGEHSRV